MFNIQLELFSCLTFWGNCCFGRWVILIRIKCKQKQNPFIYIFHWSLCAFLMFFVFFGCQWESLQIIYRVWSSLEYVKMCRCLHFLYDCCCCFRFGDFFFSSLLNLIKIWQKVKEFHAIATIWCCSRVSNIYLQYKTNGNSIGYFDFIYFIFKSLNVFEF